jgi:hypothetical protein
LYENETLTPFIKAVQLVARYLESERPICLFLLSQGYKSFSVLWQFSHRSSSMSHFATTGAIGGIQQGAAAPNRIEINDFVKNKEAFSLLIQSLSEIHSMLHSSLDKDNLL